MRRKDREITAFPEILEIVRRCKVCRLAMLDGERPYLVPLNFGFELCGEKLILYFHCAKEGKKLTLLRKNPGAAFEMDCGHRLIEGDTPCRYGFSFYSAIGSGTVSFVEDPEEKKKALVLLMKHQTGKDFAFDEAMCKAVTVLRMDVEELCGKARPYLPGL